MAIHLRRRLVLGALLSTLAAPGVLAQGAAPPPSGSAEVWAYLNKLEPAARRAVLEKEAKREARVVVYGALGIDFAEMLLEPFRKKYPDIKVDFVRLREPELVERANMETRAKRLGGDLAISNVPWLPLVKESLGPYVPTTWSEFDKRFVFGGEKDGWTAIVYHVLPATISWRTDRVDSASAPRSLAALADPKWKGRLGTTSHLESLFDGLEQAMGEAPANALIDKLGVQQNRLYPSMAALSDGLSTGEVDVAWNLGAHRPVNLKEKGAPIEFVFSDPLLGVGITVSVLKDAPNSYAAALLMEFATEVATLQILDERLKGGLLFGNLKGTYALDLKKFSSVTFFGEIEKARFARLSRTAEQKFLRGR